MTEKLNIEAQIQHYLDGEGTGQQRRHIEKMIATDPEWGSAYASFLDIHQLLSDNPLMEPSMRFTKNVMEEIEGLEIAKPIRSRQNPWVFRISGGILASILIAIIGFLVSLKDFSPESSGSGFSIPSMKVPDINWAGYIGQGTTLLLFMICTISGFYLAGKVLGNKSFK